MEQEKELKIKPLKENLTEEDGYIDPINFLEETDPINLGQASITITGNEEFILNLLDKIKK